MQIKYNFLFVKILNIYLIFKNIYLPFNFKTNFQINRYSLSKN